MQLTFPNGGGANVNLAEGELVIGNLPDVQVRVDTGSEAAVRVRLQLDESGLWLRNLGAPIHVNARPVEELAYLRPGDRLHLGSTEILVRQEQPPPALLAEPRDERRRETMPGTILLRGLSGPFAGQARSIDPLLRIGSADTCDIRLDARYAAAEEALIRVADGCIVLAGKSSVPAWINGWPVHEALLHDGDQIEIRGLRFSLHAPGLKSAYADSEESDDEPAGKPAEPANTAGARVPFARLLLAAAVLAALLTALLLFLPAH